MGANVNKVFIVGNLVRDPEVRYTNSNTAVAKITVAVNETYKQDGETKKKAEFIPVVVWGKMAENVGKFLKKGSGVFVEGKFTTRSWEDQEGKKRYASEIVAHSIQFLTYDRSEAAQNQPDASTGDVDYGHDDSVPF